MKSLLVGLAVVLLSSPAARAQIDTIRFVEFETNARKTEKIVAEGYACGFEEEIGDLRFAFLENARVRGASEAQLGLLDTYLTSAPSPRCHTPRSEFKSARAALLILIDQYQRMTFR